MAYYKRLIDEQLIEWKNSPRRKPLLIRGARQVGKSTAVRELGKQFKHYVEINLEKQPALCGLFAADIDVKKTCQDLSGTLSVPIEPGETLLFIDEIQVSKEAIMSLRYFKEDYPELHVIAAGSLLEFTLNELSSFGVGRIRSLYMYPFSFDEFLTAQGLEMTLAYKQSASAASKLPEAMHNELISQLRTFYRVGGMPAAVTEWIETKSYLEVSRVHSDILETYQDDFSKYNRRVSPTLLRKVLRSVALQVGTKFTFTQVEQDVKSATVKDALNLLTLAGLIVPVTHSAANGFPLGAEENVKYRKYLFFDLGVMLTMLNVSVADTLLSDDIDFVNKGGASEIFVGLEMMKYQDCFSRAELFYWQHMSRNGNAEVDYLQVIDGAIVPIEVKASKQGGMQSLWMFMRKQMLHLGVRVSLENFGEFEYYDKDAREEDLNPLRSVEIVPLYAVSNLTALSR